MGGRIRNQYCNFGGIVVPGGSQDVRESIALSLRSTSAARRWEARQNTSHGVNIGRERKFHGNEALFLGGMIAEGDNPESQVVLGGKISCGHESGTNFVNVTTCHVVVHLLAGRSVLDENYVSKDTRIISTTRRPGSDFFTMVNVFALGLTRKQSIAWDRLTVNGDHSMTE